MLTRSASGAGRQGPAVVVEGGGGESTTVSNDDRPRPTNAGKLTRCAPGAAAEVVEDMPSRTLRRLAATSGGGWWRCPKSREARVFAPFRRGRRAALEPPALTIRCQRSQCTASRLSRPPRPVLPGNGLAPSGAKRGGGPWRQQVEPTPFTNRWHLQTRPAAG